MIAPTVADLRAVTTVSIAQAGAFLGLSQATAYRAAGDTLPVITVGKTRRVATPVLLAIVGLPYEPPWNHDHDQSAPSIPESKNGCGLHEQAPDGPEGQRQHLRGPAA